MYCRPQGNDLVRGGNLVFCLHGLEMRFHGIPFVKNTSNAFLVRRGSWSLPKPKEVASFTRYLRLTSQNNTLFARVLWR